MGHTHGRRWTDEDIMSEVRDIQRALCIDRMPTVSECIKVKGDSSLSNVIGKRFGWYKLADLMGLPIKNSETTTGKSAEACVEEMLIHRGYRVKRMKQNFPYDLLVENCVKVDVKASHVFRGEKGSFFTFNLEKECARCDFYVLVLLDDDDKISRTMIVPSFTVMFNGQISIGCESSKYHVYTDRWDLIRETSEFWVSMQKKI